MAKRFTDTDKWKREWFRSLAPKAKIVFMYLCDQCDYCGIWPADFSLLTFQVGFKVSETDLHEWFGEKVVKFDSDKFFIQSFFDFQYGDAKDSFRAKQSAIARLQKLGLMDSNLRVSRQSPPSPPSVPDTPSIVECSVVDSFEGGTGETFGARQLAEAWNSRMISAKTMSGQKMPMVDLDRFNTNTPRYESAKARLTEEPDPGYWRDVIDRIARAQFCRGKNDRSWVADFEFLVRVETHLKVMEGKYGCTPRQPLHVTPPQAQTQTPRHDDTLTPEQRHAKAEEIRRMLFKTKVIPEVGA